MLWQTLPIYQLKKLFLLPIFLLLVLSRMQHDAMQPLFNTVVGWAVLGVIGILEVIGFFFIRKIVTIDV